MSGVHVHLVVNHVVIMGVLFGIFFHLFGLITKKVEYQRSGLALFIVAALFVVPTYFSGEAAEEVVEHLPGVSESIMHDHEEAAEKALVATLILGAAALGVLVYGLKKGAESLPSWSGPAVLVLALIAMGLLGYTGNLGGKIRHTELRAEAGAGTATEVKKGEKGGEMKKHEHDEKEEDDD